MGVGPYLKQRREELGLTLRDVERITNNGVSNALLSQIEGEQVKRPSFVTLHRLSAAYGVSLDDIAKHLDDAPPPTPPLCPTCGRVIFSGQPHD